MTTTHTTAPTPNGVTDEVTDTRAYWPLVYASVGGVLALIIGGAVGVAKLHNPWIFSIAFMIALVSLWGFQHIKGLNSPYVHWKVLVVIGFIAAIAPLLGLALWPLIHQPFPLLLVIAIALMGSAGFLSAVAMRLPLWTLVCSICFVLTLVIMGQHSMVYRAQVQEQQQIEQQKQEDQKIIQQNCDLFPAEPGCQ